MNETPSPDTLRGIAFFRGIPDEGLKQLAAISRLSNFPRGETLFREGDIGDEVYVVVKGEVSLVICTPKEGCRHLAKVTDGELLAWSPMLQKPRLTAMAHALEPTQVVGIDAEKLRGLCEENASLGYHVMHRIAEVLAERLSGARMQLMEACGLRLPEYAPETD